MRRYSAPYTGASRTLEASPPTATAEGSRRSDVPPTTAVQACLARPDALRVESLDGTLLVTTDESPRPGSYAILTTRGGRACPDPPPAVEVAPVYDVDGLVAKRPGDARYDDPMFQSCHAAAHRVRLELQTGVCVAGEELGGTRDGWGHQVRIEAVDEPTPKLLFKRLSRFKERRSVR